MSDRLSPHALSEGRRRQMAEVESAATVAVSESDLRRRLDQTSREVEHLRAENERLRTLLALAQGTQAILTSGDEKHPVAAGLGARVDTSSRAAEKVALVRSLFRGREDVYALHWESARTGKSGYAPAVAGGWGGARHGPKTYLHLTDEAVAEHLRGRESIG